MSERKRPASSGMLSGNGRQFISPKGTYNMRMPWSAEFLTVSGPKCRHPHPDIFGLSAREASSEMRVPKESGITLAIHLFLEPNRDGGKSKIEA